jgi:hypothetical protein
MGRTADNRSDPAGLLIDFRDRSRHIYGHERIQVELHRERL